MMRNTSIAGITGLISGVFQTIIITLGLYFQDDNLIKFGTILICISIGLLVVAMIMLVIMKEQQKKLRIMFSELAEAIETEDHIIEMTTSEQWKEMERNFDEINKKGPLWVKCIAIPTFIILLCVLFYYKCFVLFSSLLLVRVLFSIFMKDFKKSSAEFQEYISKKIEERRKLIKSQG
jgi:hypothetical protein